MAVWARSNVSETLLSQTIARLRRELGDTGSEQHCIRTVSRRGYRWVAPTVDADVSPSAHAERPQAPTTMSAETKGESPMIHAQGTRPRSHRRRAGMFVAALVLCTVAATAVLLVRNSPAPSAEGVDPALVLPAIVDAPSEWEWLRFGLMDIVRSRLRQGDEDAIPSEAVVGLVQNLNHSATVDIDPADPRLDRMSHLRVRPNASLVAGEWRIRLDVLDHGVTYRVDARGSDVLVAARQVADLLLIKFGKSPPPVNSDADRSNDVTDVVQRAKAATLAGKLDIARTIVESAPPAVRAAPEVVWSLALIEANAGQYEAARMRLEAALPRVTAESAPVLRARMLTLLAAMHMRSANVEPALHAYREAIALTESAREPDVLAHAYSGRGVVEATKRDYEAALADFGRARTLCEKAGNVLGIAQIDSNMGSIMDIRGQPAMAVKVLDDAARRLQALSSQEEWAVAQAALAWAKLELLDAAGALQVTETFSPPRAAIADERLRWLLAVMHARALAANGRWDEAQSIAESVSTAAVAPTDALFRAHAAEVLAMVMQARGEWASSAAFAETALTKELESADVLVFLQAWQLRLAGLQRSGAIERAAAETADFVAWLRPYPVDRAGSLAQFAAAEQARAEGRLDAALAAYAVAFSRSEQLGVPHDIVAIGAPYGTLLLAQGKVGDAAALLGRLAPWEDREPAIATLRGEVGRQLHDPTPGR